MMTIKAKIARIGEVETRSGRMGDYQTQGMMLDVTGDDGVRQSLYGTLFGSHIDTLAAQGLRGGDRVEVGLRFTTSERNGFVSNYVEFINPQKI